MIFPEAVEVCEVRARACGGASLVVVQGNAREQRQNLGGFGLTSFDRIQLLLSGSKMEFLHRLLAMP